jgi:hypothetical protein
MKKLLRITAATAAGLFLLGNVMGGVANAEPPENPECWGVVSGQLASSAPMVMGNHASQQSEPRAGLGNLSREFGFDHISEFGTFLAEIDGVDATECPVA